MSPAGDLGLQLVEGHGCATVPCRGASVRELWSRPAHQCPSSPPSSPAWSPSSARWRGSRSRSRAASPTATTALRLGGEDLVLRLCDRRRRGAGHRPHAPRRSPRAAPPPSGIAPGGRRLPRDVPALVTRWLPAATSPREQMRTPGRHGAGRRACCGACTTRRRCPSGVRRLPRSSRSSAPLAGAVPDSYDGACSTSSRRIEAAPDRPRARAGLLPQRPADRQLRARRRARVHRRLGVRGDERPLLRPRQPVGQQRLRGRATTARCSSCTSSEPVDRAALRGAAADARRLRLPRGDVGRVQHGRSHARLRLRRATRAEHFERLERAAADPRVEEWLAVAATA